MKRVLTIQDISCVGKCSLTIALPVISAMGVETAILPTALLSTHTMFKGFTFKDLSDQIHPIIDHWQNEGISFDAIYTGYLGSIEEIDLMKELFKRFKTKENFIFVDPVMGDHGKLYPHFDDAYAKKNKELCALADYIVPNLTEACLLTDTPYQEDYDRPYIEDLLQKLAALGAKVVAITGIAFTKGKTGVYGYDTRSKQYFSYETQQIEAMYHGTGDLFSSVTVGALMRGLSEAKAFKLACDYTALTIQKTLENPSQPWYGVDFEATLPSLIASLSKDTDGTY